MTFCINIQTFQFVDELRAENVPNSRKMINEMQFIQKPRPLSTSIRPSQNIYRVDNQVNEDIDPKEEAVLKQVREFLYQNMVSTIIKCYIHELFFHLMQLMIKW